jgi:TusA-related sulfurtransferase
VLQAVRDACQCGQQKQSTARLTTRSAEAPTPTNEESETMASPLPSGVSREIDVSHLPPPLPMVRILETLRDLGPGETLLVHHTRRPIHLYPKLEALGCQHETTEPAPGKIEVRITNPATRPS